MKWHTVGALALRSRHITITTLLEAVGFNLTKKIYVDQAKEGSTYYQADDKYEDRAFRMKGFHSFHLEKQRAEHGGGYR